MGNYKEFWVSFEGLGKRVASEYPVENSETNDCIHVIEKRALDYLQKQYEELEENQEQIFEKFAAMGCDHTLTVDEIINILKDYLND